MVAHLPQSIKHLLTLRAPKALPSPPLSQLNRVLTNTFRDARSKNAETGWLVLTTCSLLTVNRPSAVGHLYRFVTRSSLEGDVAAKAIDVPSAVNKAALMRESALKSTIFVGVPRLAALNKLHAKLGSYHPDFIGESERGFQSMGRGCFSNRAMARIAACFADIFWLNLAFIIQSYGSVLAPLSGGTKIYSDVSSLADLDQGNLSRALGSVVGMAALRAEGGVGPQLTSHTFGLLKARNTPNQNKEDEWLSSDEGTEWVLRTVDEILDGVSAVEDVKAKL
ncbi:hypothetical protein H1R20_g12129, partial [Candolleomyces eurysporus]